MSLLQQDTARDNTSQNARDVMRYHVVDNVTHVQTARVTHGRGSRFQVVERWHSDTRFI